MADRIKQYFCAIVFAIYPLYLTSYTNVTASKTMVFFLICLLLGIVDAIVLMSSRSDRSIQEAIQIDKGIKTCVLLLISSMTITLLFSSNPFETLFSERGLALQICYLFLFCNMIKLGAWHKVLIYGSCCALAINTMVMTLQIIGWNPLHLYSDGMTYFDSGIRYSGEYLGTLGNSNMTAIWLAFTLALCISSFVTVPEETSNGTGILGGCLSAYCGALSGTAGFVIGMAAFFVVFSIWLVNNTRYFVRYVSASGFAAASFMLGFFVRRAAIQRVSSWWMIFLIVFAIAVAAWIYCFGDKDLSNTIIGKLHPAKWRKLFISISVSLIIAGAALIYLLPVPVDGHLYEIQQMLHGQTSPQFGSNRLAIWKESLSAWAGKPVFGYGGSFVEAVDIVFTKTASNGVEVKARVMDAHNVLLSWLVHYGLVGTITVAEVVGYVIWKSVKSQAIGAKICTVAMVTCIAAEMTCVGDVITDPLFWMMAGIAMAEVYSCEKKREECSV